MITPAEFARNKGLVVLTSDDNLKKQCDLFGVARIFQNLSDFARKIKKYVDGKTGLGNKQDYNRTI